MNPEPEPYAHPEPDALARGYLELAHALEQYQPGLIDAYYGPALQVAPAPLEELAERADALLAAAEELPKPPDRRDFLTAQLRALRTSLRLLQGEALSLQEEVAGLYDVYPERVSETVFEEALAALEDLLPGSGSLAERDAAFQRRFELPAERLLDLAAPLLAHLRERTAARFGLPEGESFELKLVANEPWGAYNWYLGGYRSRIDFNTDLPLHLHDLPALLAHEAYPGHHSEHALKEAGLYRGQGRAEHALQLINAPECVLSEGVAVWAARMVLAEGETLELLLDLSKRAGLGLERADLEAALALERAARALRGVTPNAALLRHAEGATAAEVQAYLERYRLDPPERARKALEFLDHPNFRSYSFTYSEGARLLEPLLSGPDAEIWFGRLLREALTPGRVRSAQAQAERAQP